MLLHLLLVAVDVGVLGLCVVDGGWGERWGGGAKKLPIFGLFFPV